MQQLPLNEDLAAIRESVIADKAAAHALEQAALANCAVARVHRQHARMGEAVLRQAGAIEGLTHSADPGHYEAGVAA